MKKMEKQLLISVIVPVYNVKEYLSKCLETIINQTYNKLEIILIDDGSNDGSGKICDVYEKKDSRIKVIHKVNGGLSSARNDGIATANGAYIIFIDSDDYIEKTMIMDLYESAIKNNSDIVCCGKYIHKNGNVRKVNSGPEFSIGKDEALRKMLLYDDIDNSAWDKLYKAELFENIKFPVGKYYEDMGTIYKIIDRANKISHISTPEYHYVLREGSIINSKFNDKHLDMIYFSEEIKEFVEKKYPQYIKEAEAFYYLQLFTILQKMYFANNKKEFKEKYKQIKKIYNSKMIEILKNKFIPYKKKIMSICIFFNMYKLVDKIKRNVGEKNE